MEYHSDGRYLSEIAVWLVPDIGLPLVDIQFPEGRDRLHTCAHARP